MDDHRAYRLLVGSYLQKLGVEHCVCGDGQAALEALGTQQFDLLITDCRMPLMDGYTLARELRQREQAAGAVGIPVIAMTAALGPEDIDRFVTCGIDGWLTKPITFVQLRDELLYWLCDAPSRLHRGVDECTAVPAPPRLPTRVDLISTFGTWDVVEPMLLSLIHEAREDLTAIGHARLSQDAQLTTQRLHRLVGSVAFVGAVELEARAVRLIEHVHRSGVLANRTVLEQFERDLEHYLNHLAKI
nr:response regulator [uncultured Pseudomonas sp.]